VLLNILVALFNQAYSKITNNAVDEFLALFSQKTLDYIRPPDESHFSPPLNLLEIFLLMPLQLILNPTTYTRLNHRIMEIVYSPFLVIIAFYESTFTPAVAGD